MGAAWPARGAAADEHSPGSRTCTVWSLCHALRIVARVWQKAPGHRPHNRLFRPRGRGRGQGTRQLSPLRLSCMLRRARPPGERTWQALCSQKARREYGIVCHERAAAALSFPLCARPVTWSADRGDRNRETQSRYNKKKGTICNFAVPVWTRRRQVGLRATVVCYTGLVLHDTTRR